MNLLPLFEIYTLRIRYFCKIQKYKSFDHVTSHKIMVMELLKTKIYIYFLTVRFSLVCRDAISSDIFITRRSR